MDEVPIAGSDPAEQMFKRFLAHYDVPAYIRRAQQAQGAYEQLLTHCQEQRDAWLSLVRIRLGRLHALAGAWEKLTCLHEGDLNALRELHEQLAPELRLPVAPTGSWRVLRAAVRELRESIERFNRRWQGFLQGLDLSHVNALRDGYNRYYLLEKECAVRSARVARQGFVRLTPLTKAELAALLPVLPVPRLRDSA
jgi:hypothetical protein